jgi:transposase
VSQSLVGKEEREGVTVMHPMMIPQDTRRRDVTPQLRQGARCEIVRQVKQGISAREARMSSAVPMHRTTFYRLLKRVQREGESGSTDGRHGHPIKLRGEALTCLKEYCQSNPSVSSPTVQHLLQERFGLCISVSQLNRVRAIHGLSRRRVPREKKAQNQPHELSQDTTNRPGACCYAKFMSTKSCNPERASCAI